MLRKITAIILSALTVAILFASCAGSEQAEVTTTTEPATAETQAEYSETEAAETQSVQSTEPQSTVPGETVTAAQSTTVAAVSNPGEMTTEEIVKLYNDSVNRVKKEAKSVTRNYKKLSSLDEYLELPSAIESIGRAAMEQFVKGTDEPETWTSKEDINAVFPVGGTDYSSHLTPDMVKKAAVADKGTYYKVVIQLYDDKITSPAKGKGYAGVFNTVTASTFEDINIPAVTFTSVKVNGINGSIVCSIDKSTGRVTDITFRNTDVLDLAVKVAFGNMNAKFALAVEENFTIKY